MTAKRVGEKKQLANHVCFNITATCYTAGSYNKAFPVASCATIKPSAGMTGNENATITPHLFTAFSTFSKKRCQTHQAVTVLCSMTNFDYRVVADYWSLSRCKNT